MLKEICQKILAQNSYLNYFVYKYLSKNDTDNMQKFVDRFYNEDYMDNIDSIRSFRETIANNKLNYITRDITWNNAHIYGIWQAIFGDYVDKKDYYKSPAIEHGLIFHNEVYRDVLYTARMTCCTFSKFRKNIIHSKVNMPVFCVGSYIAYAKSFYDQDKISCLKNKFGSILLVFPTHSTDSSDITVNQRKFLDNIKKLALGYDTVFINSFWWNINDPLIKILESEGYKILTCGFRDDINFLPRLKAYLSLADLVVGDSIGTHVGYCLACNVPFCYMPSETKVQLKLKEELKDIEFVNYHQSKIAKEFLYTTKITDTQKDICNYYWGNNDIKTFNQIKTILQINNDILQNSHGLSFFRKIAAEKLLKKYEKEGEDNKMEMLLKAVRWK